MVSKSGRNNHFATNGQHRHQTSNLQNGYAKGTSMSFQQTLERHLQAVQAHDIDTFLETIADDGSLTMILPNGNLLDNYDEIVELHQEWFADEEWQMSTELISKHESSEMATALLLVNYEDVDEEGGPVQFQYFLNLIFAQRNGKWLVIHDQNTIIDVDPEELDEDDEE
jgi:ketosteroid isomerase-like protein